MDYDRNCSKDDDGNCDINNNKDTDGDGAVDGVIEDEANQGWEAISSQSREITL